MIEPVSYGKTIGDLEAKSSEPAPVSLQTQTEKAEGLVTPPHSTDEPSLPRERKDQKMIFQSLLLSKKHFKIEKRILSAIHRAVRYGRVPVFFTLLLCAITASRARTGWSQEPMQAPQINLSAIAMIESSGNPKAIGRTGDSGLFQITDVVRREYNQRTGARITTADLFNARTATRIADWYLHKRIPEMLRYYKKPVTARNIIIAWNAGIRYVQKGEKLPRVTEQFLKKYEKFFAKKTSQNLNSL